MQSLLSSKSMMDDVLTERPMDPAQGEIDLRRDVKYMLSDSGEGECLAVDVREHTCYFIYFSSPLSKSLGFSMIMFPPEMKIKSLFLLFLCV